MKGSTLKTVRIALHSHSSLSPGKNFLPTFPSESKHTSSIVKALYEYA